MTKPVREAIVDLHLQQHCLLQGDFAADLKRAIPPDDVGAQASAGREGDVFERVTGEEGIAVEQPEVERPGHRHKERGPAADGTVVAQLTVMEKLISPRTIGRGCLAGYAAARRERQREYQPGHHGAGSVTLQRMLHTTREAVLPFEFTLALTARQVPCRDPL